MVIITEQLIRSRAEHNELQITTLEEISLHQQDIERIEYIDKWCRELKILYLQCNLIPKLENVSRLKKLEYLNLALNNIERIENLEGCESLQKLDLTVNFIGELTSIECLSSLDHFKVLYLTGNPCTEYEYYVDYVIATLPKLEHLDGSEVTKAQRILATQDYEMKRKNIIAQQNEYCKRREKEKHDAEIKKIKSEKKPGFDGNWYTDISSHDVKNEESKTDKFKQIQDEDQKEKEFWDEKVAFTPESRIEVHEHMKEKRKKDIKEDEEEIKKPRRLLSHDGRPLNINEAKIEFNLAENDDTNEISLDLQVYKYLDTSLIDVDVQPSYVRAFIKGKVFQLVLSEEVNPDISTAKRSQITGHLLITMPKAKQIIKKSVPKSTVKKPEEILNTNSNGHERLEVGKSKTLDYANIIKENPAVPPLGHRNLVKVVERPNSEDFIDNPDVPPLI